MSIEDVDHARAASVQGDSGKPVTVSDLAVAAGVELATGEDDNAEDSAEDGADTTPRRRARAARQTEEDSTK